MGSVVVQAFVTLDGVMQAPGGAGEDDDGGFPYGGWQMEHNAAMAARGAGSEGAELIADWESRTEALLLGRRTYETWAEGWGRGDESAEGLAGELTRRYNRVPKYVASRTLTTLATPATPTMPAGPAWQHSHLLGPDVPGAVARLREERDGEIRVWGSSELIRTLAEHDLVDEYRQVHYPLVLGTGKRLFPPGFPRTRLALVESRALATGVVVTVHRPRRD